MKLSTMELGLCAAWAKAHHGPDDPIDVLVFKILDVVSERARRYADYAEREVGDIETDRAAVSANFYDQEDADPDGDSNVEF